jgi:hypothetical protein
MEVRDRQGRTAGTYLELGSYHMLLYLGTENEGHVFSLDHLECKKQRETFLFFLNGSSFILVLGLMCLLV